LTGPDGPRPAVVGQPVDHGGRGRQPADADQRLDRVRRVRRGRRRARFAVADAESRRIGLGLFEQARSVGLPRG